MRFAKWVGLLTVFMLILAACGGQTADMPPQEIKGPALVMFYTDN
jgi:hypothetical protein